MLGFLRPGRCKLTHKLLRGLIRPPVIVGRDEDFVEVYALRTLAAHLLRVRVHHRLLPAQARLPDTGGDVYALQVLRQFGDGALKHRAVVRIRNGERDDPGFQTAATRADQEAGRSISGERQRGLPWVFNSSPDPSR